MRVRVSNPFKGFISFLQEQLFIFNFVDDRISSVFPHVPKNFGILFSNFSNILLKGYNKYKFSYLTKQSIMVRATRMRYWK
jgi:hypothetical protein